MSDSDGPIRNWNVGARAAGPITRVTVVIPTLFLFCCAFFWLTKPANHTEIVDGYSYATWADIRPALQIGDSRLLYFHLLNRAASVAARQLGGKRGFEVIEILVLVTASASVSFLSLLLIRGLGTSVQVGVLGGLFLAFSYGFWRYATAVEVYAPATLCILAVLNLLCGRRGADSGNWWVVWLAGLLAGLAVLYYQPSCIPLFLAIPILFLGRGRLKRLVAYGLLGSAVAGLGYVSYYLVSRDTWSLDGLRLFLAGRNQEFEPFSFMNLPKSAAAILHNVLATSWPYSLQSVSDVLASLYPRRDLAEVVFAARAFRPGSLVPLVVLPALLGCCALVVHSGFDLSRARERGWLFLYFPAWIAVMAPIVVLLGGRHPEQWLLILPPLAVIVAILFFEKLERIGRFRLAVALVALLGTYNFFGGIGMLLGDGGDLHRARTEWLRENLRPGDIIWLTGEQNWPFVGYLRYVVGADVVISTREESILLAKHIHYPVRRPLRSLLLDRRNCDERLFVLGEFLSPNPFNRRRPQEYGYSLELAERFRSHTQLRQASPAGDTLEIVAPASLVGALLDVHG